MPQPPLPQRQMEQKANSYACDREFFGGTLSGAHEIEWQPV